MNMIEQAREIGTIISYRQNGEANITEYALSLAFGGSYHGARNLRAELSLDNPARDFISAVIHLKQGDYFLADIDCRRTIHSDSRLVDKIGKLRDQIQDKMEGVEDIKLPEKVEPEEVAA